MTIPAFPVYLFDVDGTLVDSAEDICGAIQSVLLKTSRPDVEQAFLQRYIGRHLIDLFNDLFPGLPADECESLIAQYRTTYWAREHSSTRIYPGVLEAIAALPGKKSTATTKGTPTTRIVLEKFGLLPYFDHVQGTDGFPHKPAPDVLLRSIELFGAKPEDCLMVGDAPADIIAGKRAGAKTCAVRYGYGDPVEMELAQPDYWVSHLSELVPQAPGRAASSAKESLPV